MAYDSMDIRTILDIKPGFRWQYRRFLGSDIVTDPPTIDEPYDFVRRCDSIETIADNIVFFCTDSFSLNPTGSYWITLKKNMLIISTRSSTEILLTTPIRKGTKWKVDPSGYSDWDFELEIGSTDTTVIFYNIKYEHVIYVHDNSIFHYEYFILPHVGIIEESSQGITVFRQALISINF